MSSDGASSDVPYVNAPNQPQLQKKLNELVDAINEKRRESFLGSEDISVAKEGDTWRFKLIQGATQDDSVRFYVEWDQTNSRIYVGKGHVAFLPSVSGYVTPIEPTIYVDEYGADIKIWSESIPDTEMPPYLDVPTDAGQYWVLVQCTGGNDAQITIYDTSEPLSPLNEGDFYFQIAKFEVEAGDVPKVVNLQQVWESDITVLGDEEDVSSPSSSSSVSSVPSIPGGGFGDSDGGSDQSESGPKSSAIVKASWTPDLYTALFIAEMPEVRFDDVMVVRSALIKGRTFDVPIDARYVEVCEKGTIDVVGYSSNSPIPIGFKVIGDHVRCELPYLSLHRKPTKLVIRLSAFRKDFFGIRFPNRTKKQHDENNRFINSAYSGSKAGDA